MTRNDLKVELEELEITEKEFLIQFGFPPRHLYRYSSSTEIPKMISASFIAFKYKIVADKSLVELERQKEINRKLLKGLSVAVPSLNETVFIPIKGELCFFWNKNSNILIIAPYAYSSKLNNNKIHFIQDSMKINGEKLIYTKGFTDMAELNDSEKFIPLKFKHRYYYKLDITDK